MHIGIGARTVVAKTCRSCGVLKMGTEFFMNHHSKGYHSPYVDCKQCHYQGVSDRFSQRNSETMETATARFEPWDVPSLNQLQRLVDSGLAAIEIAYRMNRTLSSIYGTISKHRIRQHHYTAIPGSSIDVSYLRELING